MSSHAGNPFDSGDGGALAELALAVSTSSHCHVIVEVTSHLNQRWARGSLTTNGSATDITVTAIAFADRPNGIAAASVTQSVSDVEGVLAAVRAADAVALLASPAEDASPFPVASVDAAFGAPAVMLSPDVLTAPTAHLGELITWGRSSGIELFGYLERESTTTWLATSGGARRRYCAPADRLEITAKSHARTRSTWHGFAAVDLGDGDWDRLRSDITQALDWQATSIAVAPGRHDALLSPSAIGDFVIDLYWSAGARDAAEGRSAFHDEHADSGTRINQLVAAPGVFVTSDPGDPLVPGSPFAVTSTSGRMSSVFDNGRSLERTDWIRDGRLDALIATGADAARIGIGQAPIIDTIRLEAHGDGVSTDSASELATRLGDGLMLTCVWYNRTVDPQTMLLTGLTRDGVYVVRDGEVIGASSNFRFNDSPLSMLNRITASTAPERTLPREMADYANNVAMPAVVVDGMNFTSLSDAR
jgi:predicted Zn-dependent protease